MRKLILAFLLFPVLFINAQILEPVKWEFNSNKIEDGVHELQFKAIIDNHWHVYSQHIDLSKEVHPIPTSFHFECSDYFKPIGDFKLDDISYLSGFITEPKGEDVYDPVFEMVLKYFDHEVTFTQNVQIGTDQPIEIKGYLEFMCCDSMQCLPPTEVEFSIPIHDENAKLIDEVNDIKCEKESSNPVQPVEDSMSLWAIFIEGFLGGLFALITPCVFPMIPMTVSYFLEQSGSKAKGISNAVFYGISIVVIYVALGFGISKAFGPDSLNLMASDPWFNIFFFLMLIVFAVSFLGAFELTLPSSWVNKMDSMADKTGGILGIFLMAFTLSLVSFSCTAPIVGSLLVEAFATKNVAAPLAGMSGFGLALGIPFSIFAIFPSMLNALPKSGGWLNSVKVVLGFLELALALKFFSNADLVMHWGLLDREVYLVLWIVIFTLLGFYLLGKLKFAHDTELEYISVPRLFFAIISFGFAFYMIPGLWGAPLKAISAFPPPMSTQDWPKENYYASNNSDHAIKEPRKRDDLFHCPHGLDCYFDYEEAMGKARKENKPLFIDFTGWSCVNCRNMEESVWSDPRVIQRFNENFVMASLYVDDRTKLDESEWSVSEFTGNKIKTIGNQWSDLEASKFGRNSQPYYVILDHEGNLLADAAFNLNVDVYTSFLDRGLEKFKKGMKKNY
ncbi:MAG: thioredoxin family protein [Bacteroidia bacterium]|nr:thioredoxin family protein [Bacteroidia bacterium]